jgi:predicted dehydrogenase
LVIGGGSIGERHVRCFLHTGRVAVELCDNNAELCEAVGRRYDLAATYTGFDEALETEPDLAVICTPAHLHLPMAGRLMEANVPVLIEKPLSTTLAGTEQLLELQASRQVPAAVAYVYRAHPALQAMRAAVLGGRFGRPVQLVANFGQHFPHYRPAYREIYYRDRATGGGAIQDALTHVVNAAEWLVGPMTRLVADAAHQVLEGVAVEDTVHVTARHGDVMAGYTLNQHQPANEGTLTVVCEHGQARFEMHRGSWGWCETPEQPWQREPTPELQRDDLFVRQAGAFLDFVDGRSGPLCSLEDAIQTLRVNLAILRSTESRTWQDLTAIEPDSAASGHGIA